MKEKKFSTEQEFEELLKDKMNELSESVDCFDKIAERAFHDDSTDFEDSEFIVTDLENITGKSRLTPVFRAAAVGIAAVFVIGIVPKTAAFRKIMCNIGSPDSNIYTEMIGEISEKTAENSGMDFHVYDMALEDYITKDVLVTPLYSCPFEDIGREDIRVRIFVRDQGAMLTNEIYAVEYSGEYTEKNFIAAAETKARFTEDELKAADRESSFTDNVSFYETPDCSDDNCIAASFSQYSLFKSGSEAVPLMTSVYYSTTDNISYSYRIQNYRETSNEVYNIPANDLKWLCSVYSSGETALPEESASAFTLYETGENDTPLSEDNSVLPYTDIKYTDGIGTISTSELVQTSKAIDIPADMGIISSLRLYLTEKDVMYFAFSSQSDPTLTLSNTGALPDKDIHIYDVIKTDVSLTIMEETQIQKDGEESTQSRISISRFAADDEKSGSLEIKEIK